jgi:hypothetical protein
MTDLEATARSICHLSFVISNSANELRASSPPMSYLTLKVIHLIALALTFMGLAGALAYNAVSPGPSTTRRIFAISHGIGLILLLITGFVMLIQLGIGKNLPGWVWGKVIIWLLAGASAVLVRRFARFQVPMLVYLAVLVGLGAWLALYKPF